MPNKGTTVRPDLTTFRHFDLLKVHLSSYLAKFGNCIIFAIGQNFIAGSGQILTK